MNRTQIGRRKVPRSPPLSENHSLPLSSKETILVEHPVFPLPLLLGLAQTLTISAMGNAGVARPVSLSSSANAAAIHTAAVAVSVSTSLQRIFRAWL